jgi:ATP-dependent RNA helicase SUPV3L1/SUV3
VARLAAGGALLKPRIVPLPSDLLIGGEAERLRDRVAAWLDREIARAFPMLRPIAEAELTGAARGLAFQLIEALAPIERSRVESLIDVLTERERRHLARLGIVIGVFTVFLKGLAKPGAIRLRAALWRAAQDGPAALPLPGPGRVSMAVQADIDPGYYNAIGYPAIGPRAIRADMLDRLMARLDRATIKGAMPPDDTIAPVLGCAREEADQVLLALGWGRREEDGVTLYRRQRPFTPLAPRHRRRPPPRAHDDRSPFAVLKQLSVAK